MYVRTRARTHKHTWEDRCTRWTYNVQMCTCHTRARTRAFIYSVNQSCSYSLPNVEGFIRQQETRTKIVITTVLSWGKLNYQMQTSVRLDVPLFNKLLLLNKLRRFHVPPLLSVTVPVEVNDRSVQWSMPSIAARLTYSTSRNSTPVLP